MSTRNPNPLVLFDVDATLLRTDGVGMRSMMQAAMDVFGPALSWDGIEASGGLDPVLVGEAARRSRVSMTPESHRAFRHRYVALLDEALRSPSEKVRAMPGMHPVVESLRSRPDITLGLLTGNYPETASIKLRAVGMDPGWFRLTVFGDEADTRPGLVALALRKYEALGRGAVDPSRVIIVGDTPKDVDAALKNGCRALGVATGKYGIEALRAAGAHSVVETLEDPTPLWTLLGHR